MSTHHVPTGSIVVGVDGSPSSDQALDWATAEAVRRGLPLQVVHAFSYHHPLGHKDMGLGEGLREMADDICRTAVARARAAGPELDITWDIPQFAPAPAALVAASKGADTVVVGSRGRGAIRGALIGSVSAHVAAHAHCPAVIVHDSVDARPPHAPVVLGVDGSAPAVAATRYAFAHAASQGAPLTVVHSSWLEYTHGPTGLAGRSFDWEEQVEEESRLIEASMIPWQEQYPQVAVRVDSAYGHPVDALVEQSQGASLLVVGSRGRGGFRGLLMGSVSQGVLHGAQCPVAILHGSGEHLPADSSHREPAVVGAAG